MSELFDARERAAWGGFIATQARLFQRIEEDLQRRAGLSHSEFEVLLRLRLAPDGRMRLQDLAARCLLSPSGTSRAVERLGRAGLVLREPAPEDRRGAYAVLSPEGRATFEELARHHVALVRREFLSRFREEELDQMAEFWARARPDPDAPK